MKKALEVECAIPYKSMEKPTTSSSKIVTEAKNLHISCTGILSTYMDRQYRIHKNFEAGTTSWLNIEKSPRGNRVQ